MHGPSALSGTGCRGCARRDSIGGIFAGDIRCNRPRRNRGARGEDQVGTLIKSTITAIEDDDQSCICAILSIGHVERGDINVPAGGTFWNLVHWDKRRVVGPIRTGIELRKRGRVRIEGYFGEYARLDMEACDLDLPTAEREGSPIRNRVKSTAYGLRLRVIIETSGGWVVELEVGDGDGC